MELLVKCVVLCSLFIAAMSIRCNRDIECKTNSSLRCPSGQEAACSQGQCLCKEGSWCVFDRNCQDNCNPDQTYYCRFVRCYCL
ncbi:uncharacterized protein LOC128167830 [Crassostrea angulata]|uniref:uncharacterized protein LOC128167830 n=1 Tax=Magallana angulata TaxID=2784310 RepID=UPI0022B0E740|nr:uncharacterized protein LOC128167830 [Crassostrea angulata]